jgi:hypothetical protein
MLTVVDWAPATEPEEPEEPEEGEDEVEAHAPLTNASSSALKSTEPGVNR